jgi:hypothetical protein
VPHGIQQPDSLLVDDGGYLLWTTCYSLAKTLSQWLELQINYILSPPPGGLGYTSSFPKLFLWRPIPSPLTRPPPQPDSSPRFSYPCSDYRVSQQYYQGWLSIVHSVICRIGFATTNAGSARKPLNKPRQRSRHFDRYSTKHVYTGNRFVKRIQGGVTRDIITTFEDIRGRWKGELRAEELCFRPGSVKT